MENESIKDHSDSSRKVKILIVDDDEASTEYLRILIQAYAEDIFTAQNGMDAVKIYEAHPEIGLILMDLKMPEMGGLVATRTIRDLSSDVVIVVQTACVEPEDHLLALDAGSNDCITKPIDRRQFQEMIHKYLPG